VARVARLASDDLTRDVPRPEARHRPQVVGAVERAVQLALYANPVANSTSVTSATFGWSINTTAHNTISQAAVPSSSTSTGRRL
jgi:hypothetical protein